MDNRILEDFPVDWQEDQYISRREFVKFLTLVSGGMAVGSAVLAAWVKMPRNAAEYQAKEIARLDEMPVGGWKQFAYPGENDACILIRTGEDTVAAYSRKCTHLSCPVGWQKDRKRLYCPCHNGAFSVEDGHVLQGPPGRPLPRIELSIENGAIYAVGVAEGGA
ncbi:MAG TPA: Rieske 2Fe-2S domain-containing protein [Fimbriimonadales bacterium]|jgi:Rieske Fe-S protein|nr:Rieske 2Fe-2S domain-containing protein [Fimbriimonadales bacterium]